MAGVTGIFNVIAKGYIERLMRVGVTAETIFQAKMCFSLMAFGALGDQGTFFNSGRMGTFVTFKAGHFRLVLARGFIDLFDLCRVAFLTVVITQFGAAKCSSLVGIDNKDGECEAEHGRCSEQDWTSHFFPPYTGINNFGVPLTGAAEIFPYPSQLLFFGFSSMLFNMSNAGVK